MIHSDATNQGGRLPAAENALLSGGRRLTALDGIRGIAALAVLVYHGFHVPLAQVEVSGLTKLIYEAAKPGWLGVDLFFVLSGFLITGILLDSRADKHYFRNFYARRVLRIVPLYYAALLVLFVCYRDSGPFALLGCFYLTNFASLFGVPMLFGPLWSLSVEEHFYLLWPWAVRFVNRRALAGIAVAVCLISPVARAAAYGNVHFMDIYYFSCFRFDGLAWGALLALFVRSRSCTARNLKWFARAAACGGLLILIGGIRHGILSREQFLGSVLLYSAAQLVFIGLIAAALNPGRTRLKQLLGWRPLRWCGDVSYCFYLFHVFCFHAWDWSVEHFGIQTEAAVGKLGNVALRFAFGTAAAFLIAALSYRYFEAPILRLKRHFSHDTAADRRTEITGALKAERAA